VTRRANARIAGVLFLAYIATGIGSMMVYNRATAGAEGTAAVLESIAAHPTLVRLTVVLTLFMFVYAVGLGVTLYALTRDQDPDLALTALLCRAAEGIVGAASASETLRLVALAATSAAAAGVDAAATQALGGLMLGEGGWSGNISAACFAIGSTIFCWLFIKARSIPVALAWLGFAGSALLVVAIPLQIAGFLTGMVNYLVWIPMALFEVVLAFWLIIKGVKEPGNSRQPA
jgi:hypothetical protein